MTDKLIAEIDTTLASLKKPHWCDTGAGSCSICQSRKMMIDLLHQCRDRMPEPNSFTMPRSVYEMMANRRCKRCGHQPQPPQQAEQEGGENV